MKCPFMYVCVCNKVTDSQLRDAVAAGAHSIGALQRQLNLGGNCGTCLDLGRELLNESLQTLLKDNPDLYYAA